MSRNLSVVAVAATLCIAVGVSQANANLILNPSFESPVLGAPFYSPLGTSDVTLAPWVIASGAVEHVNAAIYGPAQSGVQWLSLENYGLIAAPNNFGTVSQTFATTVGHLYEGSFYYAAIVNTGALNWTMTYNYGTGPIPLNISEVGTPVLNVTPWVQANFTFVATGPTTTLSFTGQSQAEGFYGPGIDNVVVQEVPIPEPSTLALLGLGAIGLAIRTRRRRTAA